MDVRRLRALAPGLGLAAALVGLGLLMDRGAGSGLPRPLVEAAALGHFAILLLGPLAIHPLAFFRRAGAGARVVSDLLPVAAWGAGQVAVHRELGHGALESLYLTFSLPTYLLLQLLALEIVVAEAVCRLVARRRRDPAAPRAGSRRRFLAAAAAVAAWVATDPFLVIRYFLGHQRLHRVLFGRPLPEPAARPAALPAGAAPSPRRRPPNLVVILSDDHRADALGCAGHPFLETPALDRLAREGMRMRNAFVTCSLCSPSRGSFLTGQYPHRHGVLDNGSPWSDRNRTFFEPLARAGYRNAFVGKWH
ncbi:MAG: sulfatase-like hydrolase/transferase, partial [Myxococcota bacterium]|nr:sulfatase-like hydrolase/transferase [Myxococcota bacterium]